MRVAISGGRGFLGWHTAVRLHAIHGIESVLLGREDFDNSECLSKRLDEVDTIIHLAGVNRAASDDEVETGNLRIAQTLADAVTRSDSGHHIVYGNSVQSKNDTPYGRGKAGAAQILRKASEHSGGTLANVVLPNLFGEHGRPNYNSFVATFCDQIAHGGVPEVKGDKRVPLLHAQRAAENLISVASERESRRMEPAGDWHQVSDVLRRLLRFHEAYAEGQIPILDDGFSVDLFNTYRSYMFPQHFPFTSKVNADERGELFETVRVHGAKGQTFVSSTVPGAVRGQHYHLSKVERFFVLKGTAEISLRRILDNEVIRFRLTGDDHAFVDMPTMWAHNITNVGKDEVLTMFWSDQLLDPAAPDTYREKVEPEGMPHS